MTTLEDAKVTPVVLGGARGGPAIPTLRKDRYWISRWDVIVGCIVTDVVAFFIIVACAYTLHSKGIAINDAADAARSLEPLAGRYASALFAVGLLNASLFSAAILPLATVYYVCEAFGWEAGLM